MGESELEIDAWFRERIAEIHGIDPADPAAPNERIK